MEASEEGNGVDPFENLPSNLRELLDDLPFVEGDNEEEEELYKRGESGLCMTCNAPLGEDTMLILASGGVLFIACGGACVTDMNVIGWLQEQHQDIVQKVKFRGGGADDAPKEGEES